MAAQNHDRIEIIRTQTQNKIDSLLTEFSEGKINREQFHAVYAHHNARLKLAEIALVMDDDSLLAGAPGETLAIKQAHEAKAIGLMIYHNRSGMYVDTLGSFDVSSARIAPILNDFSMLMDSNELIDRRVEKIDSRHWLLIAAGEYTTVVTLFHNEPSAQQSREIERLHHDFEIANRHYLNGKHVEVGQSAHLAYPFLVFIQQKLRKN